ncbi:glycosyltransferase family 2 protein [Enterococcus gilvus]|uniref:glycosyltransferase family 2 protein n=1 Tax=Enterococcus gilvus TaxID=160453 RepID=UPI00345E354B
MKSLFLSIIIPVYNVEDYIHRCLDSVLGQNISCSYEIIIIDDGSTDTSGEICDGYKKMNEKIIVIHKENEGLGYARNTGLKAASGKFCMFIDSDDYLLENSVNRLIKSLKEDNVDTVIAGFTRENKLKKQEEVKNVLAGKVFTGSKIISEVLEKMLGPLPSGNDYIEMSVWKCIFSMDIIKEYNILFPSEREFISEDIHFDLEYYTKCKKVCISDDCGYVYCENSNSLTQKYNSQRFERQKNMYVFLINKISLIDFSSSAYLRAANNFLGNVRHSIKQEANFRKHNGKDTALNNINRIIHDETLGTALAKFPINENPIKQRIFNYLICKKSIKLIYLLSCYF